MGPQIIDYLVNNGETRIETLTDALQQVTRVEHDKIEFRITQMIESKELVIDNSVVSLPSTKRNNDSVGERVKAEIDGRLVKINSYFDMEEIGKIRKSAGEVVKKEKEEILEELASIEKEILDKHNPLDLLATVSTMNLFSDPETYTESSFKGSQLVVETVQNMILRNEFKAYNKTHETDFSKILERIDKLAKRIPSYYMLESITKKDFTTTEAEVFMHLLGNFLIVRGTAYSQHYEEISRELFSKIEGTLRQKGFSISDYWATVKEIERQIEHRYNEPLVTLRDFQEKVMEYVAKRVAETRNTDFELFIEQYKKENSDECEKVRKAYSNLPAIFGKGIYEVEQNPQINGTLMDLLSTQFGENSAWHHPLDQSLVPVKPAIKVEGKYYCYLQVHLVRNVIAIIESILSQADKDAISYHEVKGDFFEAKALGLLSELTNGTAHANLFYQKDKEIDGIIEAKDILFLIEIKGKKKRIIAGVEDILQLTKEDFVSNIDNAFEQAKRAFEYIQSKEEAEFRNEEGKVVLRIRKKSFKDTYIINVCVEDFSKLALDVNLVRRWDPKLLRGSQNPWVVSIYDLIVIRDLLGKQGTLFLDYLKERVRVSLTNELNSSDEIDFLGYFMEFGHLRKTKALRKDKLATAMIVGFSQPIDRYYSFLRGEIKYAKKPTFKGC